MERHKIGTILEKLEGEEPYEIAMAMMETDEKADFWTTVVLEFLRNVDDEYFDDIREWMREYC